MISLNFSRFLLMNPPVCIAAEPNPSVVARLRRWMDLAGVQQGAIIAQRAGQLQRRGVLCYSIAQL